MYTTSLDESSHWDLPEILGDLQVLLSLKILLAPDLIPSHSSAEKRRISGFFSLSARISPDKWSMQFIHDQCPQNKSSCKAPRKLEEPTP